jgi:hypothetical protein
MPSLYTEVIRVVARKKKREGRVQTRTVFVLRIEIVELRIPPKGIDIDPR